jgi:hypothetical protein
MIISKNTQENESQKTTLSCEYEASPLIKSKNKKNNNIMDKEIGSLRSNFTRAKIFFNNTSILDRDMGTLRSNFLRIKIFFKNIFCYIRSFFTKKKVNEVRAIFSYKKTLKEQSPNDDSISSNPENESNKLKH